MANLIVISQTSLYPKISMVMYVWPASIRLSSLCEWFCGHTSSLTIRFKTPRLSRLSPVSNSTFELPVLSSHVPSSLTFRLRPYFCNSPQTMSLKPLISLDTYFFCPHTSPSLSANPVSWWTLEQWDIEWSQWIIWCRWHRHRPVIYDPQYNLQWGLNTGIWIKHSREHFGWTRSEYYHQAEQNSICGDAVMHEA